MSALRQVLVVFGLIVLFIGLVAIHAATGGWEFVQGISADPRAWIAILAAIVTAIVTPMLYDGWRKKKGCN